MFFLLFVLNYFISSLWKPTPIQCVICNYVFFFSSLMLDLSVYLITFLVRRIAVYFYESSCIFANLKGEWKYKFREKYTTILYTKMSNKNKSFLFPKFWLNKFFRVIGRNETSSNIVRFKYRFARYLYSMKQNLIMK